MKKFMSGNSFNLTKLEKAVVNETITCGQLKRVRDQLLQQGDLNSLRRVARLLRWQQEIRKGV